LFAVNNVINDIDNIQSLLGKAALTKDSMAVAVASVYAQHSFNMSSDLAAAELRYQQSTTAIDLLVKDEEIRRTRLGQLPLDNDIDRLNDQIFDEAERGDAAEAQSENWREEAEDTSDKLERTLNELRARTRELETLKVMAHAGFSRYLDDGTNTF